VRHFPPGTSKWNKIEHRMFSPITRNRRGRPLVSHEVIIELIANTTTQKGLKIGTEIDTGHYPTGLSVAEAELAASNLKRADFHGEWNYTLPPLRRTKYSSYFDAIPKSLKNMMPRTGVTVLRSALQPRWWRP
jgi:hypothetical protein